MSSPAHPDARVPAAPERTDQAAGREADAAGGVARSPSSPTRQLPRGLIFAVLAVACVVAAAGYVTWAVVRDDSGGEPALTGPVETSGDQATLTLVEGGTGSLLFQNAVSGDYWGRVGLVPLGGPEWPRSMLPLGCQRIHFAADRGLCLAEDGGSFSTDEGLFATHAAYIVGPDFRVLHKLAVSGIPSRARVAPDGRYGATTVFVSGHSYAEAGFSTETTLIDLASGDKVANLEEFAVSRNGERFESIDFNFWGVTFLADSNRFYATLATQGETYLVEGDVGARQARVLRDNVECPSLSPDGTRIAFKKRVARNLGAVTWRFHVLDLATMTETPLAETRSVDDQIEWLDDDRVLYGSESDIWTVPADGSGQPERFMSKAASPAVVRTASPPPPDPASAPVDSLTLPSIDLAVSVAEPPAPAVVGEDATYTITVTNQGSVDATEVLVDHHLAEGVEYGGANTLELASGSWGCSLQDEGRRVTCDTLVLPSGQSWTIALTVRPAAAGTMTNRVEVHATEPDANAENDTASTETVVTAAP